MLILTLLLSGMMSGTDVVSMPDTTKTIDLTGTVIVNAEYAGQPVGSVNTSDVSVVDTLDTADEYVKILLYGDKTWRYIKKDGFKQKPEIFKMYWETTTVNPYQKTVDKLPEAWAIWLVDSLDQFHVPFKGGILSKYGPRRGRVHQGIDLPLTVGTPVYVTFPGQVRVSRYSDKGYGNVVVVRHENGLETVYGHLSERKVSVGDWVNAGQVLGLGGSTGRSTGPHLHFEMRYQGFSFDPEWIIDFKKGELRQRLFVLKKKYFGVNRAEAQSFEAEEAAAKAAAEKEAAEKVAAEKAAADERLEAVSETETAAAPAATQTPVATAKPAAAASEPVDAAPKPAPKPSTTYTTANGEVWHVVVEGDTLYALASRNRTTVAKVCELNNITETVILQIGQKLRLK